MRKSRLTEGQIVNILKEVEAGASLEDLSRQHGFGKATTTSDWMLLREYFRDGTNHVKNSCDAIARGGAK